MSCRCGTIPPRGTPRRAARGVAGRGGCEPRARRHGRSGRQPGRRRHHAAHRGPGRAAGIPVLGVNLGQLGYLTEVEPDGLEHALERFLAGDYGVEERMTLEVELRAGGPRARGRRSAPSSCSTRRWWRRRCRATPSGVAASIAGRPFVTYAADGLLVCHADRIDGLQPVGPGADPQPAAARHRGDADLAAHAVRPHPRPRARAVAPPRGGRARCRPSSSSTGMSVAPS